MTRRTQKTQKHDNFYTISNDFSDEIHSGPELYQLIGYEDCATCYFRTATLKRISQAVKQLRRRDA